MPPDKAETDKAEPHANAGAHWAASQIIYWNFKMFDIICNFPLSSDLFAQAIHPTESVIAVGLSSGHVESFKLPPLDSSEPSSPASGCGQIKTSWRTKRHKISCRSLIYSLDGDSIYSAGADGIVKEADSASGRVRSKIAIPLNESTGGIDSPTLLHNLSPQTLLLGTDSSALHVYDLRSFPGSRPQSTYRPHDDYVSSLTPLPPSEASTSGFSKQWVSVGGTTLAVTDIRKGVISQSSDQDSELLSTTFVDGFSTKGTNVGSKAIVGDGNGVLTLWERGVWDDQDERIVIDRNLQEAGGTGESVECIANIPREVAGNGKMIACGMGAGLIVCVQLEPHSVAHVLQHDEIEAVVALGFDSNNRMISGGGQIVKVWQEKMEVDVDTENEDEPNGHDKRPLESDSDDSEDNSSSEEEAQQKKSRKKKKKKGSSSQNAQAPAMGSFKGLD